MGNQLALWNVNQLTTGTPSSLSIGIIELGGPKPFDPHADHRPKSEATGQQKNGDESGTEITANPSGSLPQ